MTIAKIWLQRVTSAIEIEWMVYNPFLLSGWLLLLALLLEVRYLVEDKAADIYVKDAQAVCDETILLRTWLNFSLLTEVVEKRLFVNCFTYRGCICVIFGTPKIVLRWRFSL